MELSGSAAWLTFLGAVVGGLLGVIGALIVAASARRRENRTSAAYLWADLDGYVSTVDSFEEYCLQDDVTYAEACTEFYLTSPRLSDDFGFHAARILHVDPIMPTVVHQINVLRGLAERELDMLDEQYGKNHPKYSRPGYEAAFEFALTLKDWANYVVPVLERVSRTGPSALLVRLWRRVEIRFGDKVPFIEVPEDVREIRNWFGEDAPYPTDDYWQERLKEERKANCEEHWEEIAVVGDEMDEEDRSTVEVETSVELES